MVLRLPPYDTMKWVYPALAIFEVSASDACFSFSIVICRILSLRHPISSACCLMVLFKYRIKSCVSGLFFVSLLQDVGCNGRVVSPMVHFVLIMVPLPVSSHSAEMPN